MKKIFSIILVLSMVAVFMPSVVIAETSGTCGENVNWTLDNNGVLTISGEGDMTDYDFDGSPFFNIYSDIRTVIIEEGVTSIGASLFCSCYCLTNVSIPDGLTNISNDAFYGCKALTNITIPDSVTRIGDSAFSNCDSLKNIIIPDNVTSLGASAFYACGALTNITIPDSITSIDKYTFYGCKKLTSITIPYSITNIDKSALLGNTLLSNIIVDNDNKNYCSIDNVLFDKNQTELILYPQGKIGTSYIIPNTVTTICESAFRSCKLTSVTIPDSVTSIGELAFNSCKSLSNIIIPDSVTSIGWGAFYGTGYYNNASNWENGVLYIGNHLITADSEEIDSEYVIKETCKTIAATAFLRCSSLTSVSIPDSVTSIGERAFAYCSSLTSVTIPNSVTSIGDGAFFGCSSLTDVYYGGTETDWGEIAIESGNGCLTNANIHYNSAAPTPIPTPLPTTTAEITRTDAEADTAYTFEVDAAEKYENCYVYAAVYDESGALLAVRHVPLELTGITSISVDKKDNAASAKVFIWTDALQPIIAAVEFPLI